MRSRLSRRAFASAAFLLFSCAAGQAEVPEGPPVPSADLSAYVAHSRTDLDYYLATQVYRYRGRYAITYNAFRVGKVGVYGFGDADVEVRTGGNQFQPDRLLGTFEGGVRGPVGQGSVGVFVRHFSSHNVDRDDRAQPSWEQLGARWQWSRGRWHVDLSGATYFHHDHCRYQSDVDAHAAWLVVSDSKHPLTIEADLHRVGETGGGRSEYVDYWIEPDLGLSKDVVAYVGYGTVHDIDMADGRSDDPVMVGLKVLL
jgi:hypothetical protein